MGLHIKRHSAAKSRRGAGGSVETVSAFFDHSPLAATTMYLGGLEGVEDHSWERVAESIGVQGRAPRATYRSGRTEKPAHRGW